MATLNELEIIALGAGQEVGRSCIIIKYMCASTLLLSFADASVASHDPRPPSSSVCMHSSDVSVVRHWQTACGAPLHRPGACFREEKHCCKLSARWPQPSMQSLLQAILTGRPHACSLGLRWLASAAGARR